MNRADTLVAAFHAAYQRHPESLAVTEASRSLSYRELNLLSERFALRLASLGVGPGDAVGIRMPRCLSLPAALLGILKCGACYVPIDPDAPAERQLQCLNVGGVKALISADPLHGFEGPRVEPSDLPATSARSFLPLPDARHLACLLFTSGSTGEPKAVEVEQAGILRTTLAPRYLPIPAGTRFACLSNPTFDALTLEVFGALLNGGTLVIFSRETVLDPDRLAQQLVASRIDTLFLTAALFNALVELRPDSLASTRDLLVGGEALRPASVAALFKAQPQARCRLYNAYGPTECTTFALTHPIDPNEVQRFVTSGSIPIGLPIDETEILIVNDMGRPAGPGESGELWIAGAGLARGYRRSPELTGQRFVRHPDRGETRWYKTGDRVRQTAEGLVDFIGRVDAQVKVRGHRVELTAVEHRLSLYPGIRDVCVCPTLTQDSQRLDAYLVMADDTAATVRLLRKHLASQLPPYMIPQGFLRVAELPRNNNGKIDRQAVPRLPAEPLALGQTALTSVSAANQSEVQAILAAVMGRNVELDTSFTEAGGDSLTGMRLLGKIAQQLKLRGQVDELMNAATLAEFIGTLKPDALASSPGMMSASDASYPASTEQARMVFLQRLAPDANTYNAPFVYRIDGKVDAEALGQALHQLILRHPVLATVFRDDQNGLLACPQSGVDLPLERFETTHEAEAYCDAPFDLTQPPLVRAALVTTEEQTNWFYLCLHHVATDGHSMNRMLRDLSRDYAAAVRGQPLPPPEPALPYRHFAEVRRTFQQTEAAEHQRARWRQRLADTAELYKPLFSTQASPRLAGAIHETFLSKADWDRFAALARREGVTDFSLLLTVFSLCLAKLTGQSRLAIGIPVANRGLGDFDELTGLCVNTLPCFVELDMNSTLHNQLQAVHRQARKTLADPDIDYDVIAESRSKPATHDALFDVMLVLENTRPDLLRLPGLTAQPQAYSNGSAKFPLTLFVTPTPDGDTQLLFEFAPALLNNTQVESLAAGIRTLLQNLQHRLDSLMASLPVAADELERWETNPGEAVSRGLMDRFNEAVRLHPERAAVLWQEKQYSYEALNSTAEAIARCLLDRGFGQGDRIGLCLERSAGMVAALLGVLKIGAAYVPLDPDYPTERLTFLVEDSGLGLIIACNATMDHAAQLGGKTLNLDALPTSASQQIAIPSTPSLDSCAYVIYTSGSTGLPKGVMISHGALANYLDHARRRYCARTDLSVVSSSLNFDATITTLLAPLASGLAMRLLPQDRQEVRQLAGLLNNAEERLLLKITPSHLWALRGYLGETPTDTAHCFVIGGEAFSRELAGHYRRRFPKAEFVNEYGPTETVVGCMEYWVPKDEPLPATLTDVPIGRPIANAEVRVLDVWGGRCPVAVEGELYIGGAGVGMGYHNRDDLTAERFKRFADGRRYYASGDYAYWSADGQLHYTGRRDDQLKIRGYRIETGEVEAHLRALPGVSQAAVAAKTGTEGDVRLLGYLVMEDPGQSLTELREQLRDRLPAHLVPDALIPLTELPFTPNGKLDRDALPEVAQAQPDAGEPATEAPLLQLLVAQISSVLGYDIDPELNFFEAGMNSLLLMKVHGILTTEHGLDFDLVDFFSYPNTRALAHYLGDQAPAGETTQAPTKRNLESEEIAVVGMAVNLPGAPDLATLWTQVLQGREGIEHQADKDSTPREGRYQVHATASMAGLFEFDPAYFGLTPAEAELMDPQQRHLLMGAVHALENAGLAPGAVSERVGIYVSSSENTYQQALLRAGEAGIDRFQMSLLNEKDFVSSRLAYHLNLTGPALTIQSACSSSLSAVHIACQQLRLGECDIALAGGVSADPALLDGYEYRPGRIFSKDGHCRAFSDQASGTVPANGMGMVVLKSLTRAQAEGDRIYATIKGSALNNDGRDKVSYFAPSVSGQTAVIEQALAAAGVEASHIGYLEAHGTGTDIGDPIEVEALTRAFRASSEATAYCALASAKSQFGHLASAAGVVGLIRATLGVYHGVLPPTLGAQTANPRIPFAQSPFYLNHSAKQWTDSVRLAGVSSFGMGGTNAHVIVGNVPATIPRPRSGSVFIPFSAKTASALQASLTQAHHKLVSGDCTLAQLGAIQARSKAHYSHRAGFAAHSVNEALALLSQQIESCSGNAGHGLSSRHQAWLDGGPLDDAPPANLLPLDTLPYPFDRQRYRRQLKNEQRADSERKPMSAWLHQPSWTARQRIRVAAPQARARLSVGASPGWSHALNEPDAPCLHCEATDWKTALAQLPREGDVEILYWAEPHRDSALLRPVQLLQDWIAQRGSQPLYLTLLATGTAQVGPDEALEPIMALLTGLIKVAPVEHPQLKVRLVDLPQRLPEAALARPLMAALADLEGHLALRQNCLWQKSHTVMTSLPSPTPLTPAAGTYLVFGGLGGVGRAVMDHLAQAEGVTLISLSRSGAETHLDPGQVKTWGQAAHYDLAGDIGCEQSMRRLADAIQTHVGALTGIVHCAGLPGQGVLAQLDEVRLGQALTAKVDGLDNIQRHFLPLTPAWMVTMSSMSAIIGVPGQTDYAAANAYADAWTAQQARQNQGDTVFMSINWPTWQNSGMAAGYKAESPLEADFGISVSEGIQLFETALSLGLPQLAVAPVDIERMQRHFAQARRKAPLPAKTEAADPVAEAFCQVLGLEDVAEDDDFQDLGGDSLTALDVLDLLEPQFPGRLNLGNLLTLGTPGAIRAYLKTEPKTAAPQPESPLVSLQQGSMMAAALVHPIGGDLVGYRSLITALPPQLTVLGLRDPALDNADAPARTVQELAALYLTALGKQKIPALVGWSFGALVAWEMARQMEAQDRSLERLILIDPPIPGLTVDNAGEGSIFEQELDALYPELAAKQADAPALQDIDPYLKAIARVCDRNAEAMVRFQPQGRIETPTTLFVACQGDRPPPGIADRPGWLLQSWQPLCAQPISVQPLETDHYGIMTGPWAERISQVIGQAHLMTQESETTL